MQGNALRAAEVRAGSVASSDPTVEAAMRFTESLLATGEFPHTAALFGGARPRDAFAQLVGARSERERFLSGLTTMLDGAAARFHLSPRPARSGSVRR